MSLDGWHITIKPFIQYTFSDIGNKAEPLGILSLLSDVLVNYKKETIQTKFHCNCIYHHLLTKHSSNSLGKPCYFFALSVKLRNAALCLHDFPSGQL